MLQGDRQYLLETELPAQILFLFEPGQRVVSPFSLRDAEFVVGLQLDNIFRLGNVYSSGEWRHETVDGVQKDTIDAHPPEGGQTILQFLLSLPETKEIMFSFSVGLLDEESRNDGVTFEVLLNGQNRFKHFTKTLGWTDAQIPLSEFAGEVVLLELVTDSGENDNWDWAHWADPIITAEGDKLTGDANGDGAVNILDMVLVAQNLGQKSPSNLNADVNKDGQVNILDLVFVAERLGEKVAAAPSQMDIANGTPSSSGDVIVVRRAMNALEAVPEKSQSVEITLQFLHAWLANADQRCQRDETPPELSQPLQS